MAEAESVPTKQCARHECVRIRWHVSFGVSHCWCHSRNSGQRTPNDPKLSDGGGWRDGCAVGERGRPEAASVTAGAVRCSAWLGRFVILVDVVVS